MAARISGKTVRKAGTCRERKSNMTHTASQASRSAQAIIWAGKVDGNTTPPNLRLRDLMALNNSLYLRL
jgi:hypothetical protein